METQIKKRIDWLDIAKGIAIISTIIGHSFDKNEIGIFIFSFHMPLFFILSGYTLKKIQLRELKKSTIKDFKRLIVPIFIVLVIQIILSVFLENGELFPLIKKSIKQVFWGTCNRGVGRLWFLVALFYSKFFFRIVLIKIPNYREIFLLFGTYIFSVAGLKLELPQNFDLIFVSMLFMDIGYIFKNQMIEDSKTVQKFGIVAFFIWTYLIWNKHIYTDLAQRLYPPLAIIAAICGSLCIIQLSKLFAYNRVLTNLLGFFGKRSLSLLCIHQLDRYFSKYVNYFSFDNSVKLSKLNPYIHCCINLFFNVLVLLILVVMEIVTIKIYRYLKSKVCEKLINN